MNSEQCADDKLILGGSHSNITMVAKMYHTILPKYQPIEIRNTSKTSKKSFDSIMMFAIVFLPLRSLRYDIQKLRYLDFGFGWRPFCIDKYSIVYFRCNSLKLNIYYQAFKSSFYPKKVKLCTFC